MITKKWQEWKIDTCTVYTDKKDEWVSKIIQTKIQIIKQKWRFLTKLLFAALTVAP